ncbi:Glycine betaine/proline betaine transporter BetS [Austwickia sp. TVS 96-490-7B]|uniref:BCCT family transporter n=1 Tax=Austwickia sp. TVS 96-490-7B TaxID=2830843 RepID=UPI001C576E96|nr:BCCT family transporter [Austwickia sp. TVS 96-490-7B]MBW3084815.1 Glycine betaine/proline betaine transporter BetS [Austwickia sp. TVS 96-490-7B]
MSTTSPTAPLRAGIAPRVFYPAVILIGVFVIIALAAPARLKAVLTQANTTVIDGLGWYYVLIVTGFVMFCLYAGLSRWGEVRLGPDDEAPAYGLTSWFAMLFAAGMGIGLVFWGVAEPLNHFASPPPGTAAAAAGSSPAVKAQEAMTTTFLHWGLHAWAIYIVVALALALSVHRRGRPVSIRWALEPLLGERVRGFWGDVIDVVAIVGTLFGVATSLGFGVTQLTAGLDFLGVAAPSITLMLILVTVITAIAMISVVSGLDVGIKWLSNGNLILAVVLMVLVLVLGPSLFLLREFVQNLGAYIQNILGLSFRTMPFQGDSGSTWLSAWTTYYWGWWMSWSPFVGVFIARISRGRTVREFVGGVLLVPTLVTFLWFSILGGTAIYRQIVGDGALIKDGAVSTSTALFQMLSGMPGGSILAGLFLLLIVIFFVTSADSGSLVVAMLASGGDELPPVWTRVVWSALGGAIAIALLWGGARAGELTGGLSALQTMAILVAAPFSLVMVAMCIATSKALHREVERLRRLQRSDFARELVEKHDLVTTADL